MRCLYCGKELALLKRWTGGGEFCTDAHRQRYQEEYNQLALNRLLQAKPPSDAPAVPLKPGTAAKPAAVAEPAVEIPVHSAPRLPASHAPVSERAQPVAARPVAARIEAPVSYTAREEFAAPVEHEEPAPAEMAGFLVELPVPGLVEVPPMSHPDLEFFLAVAAALPTHAFEPSHGSQGTLQLETAGPVTLQPSNQASNYTANGSRDRRLEVRDFVRTAPIVEIDLSPAGETGLETSSEAMDILFFPQPPNGSPALWQMPPVGFSAGETELGDLARLSFATTGFSDQPEPDNRTAVAVPEPFTNEQLFTKAEPVTNTEPIPEPEPLPELAPFTQIENLVEPEPIAPIALAEAAPEPIVETPPEPIVSQSIEPEHIADQPVQLVAEQVTEQPAEPAAEPAAPVPDAVTRALPLVLQVAGPGKPKTVQIFSSASSAVAVQVPRSTSLPLRPVMTFGPAPVKSVNGKPRQDVRADVKADLKPDVKPASKAPQPELVKQAAPVEVASAKQTAKSDSKRDSKKPEVRELKPKEELKDSKQAEPLPAPLAAPYPGSGDLGLPRLNLQSSPGFWGGLPIVAKIAIVVVLLSGLGGLIAYTSKSSGAAVTASSKAGTVVTGAPLPVGDAGWITDWGADPGVRRTRQISILRSSQTLTDYRIEMQGQIETKAIGWVFRAADPKNFYVTKLEIVKPGLEPSVALVRFAVINGEEQAHAQIPLPMKVRRDTMYKIQFDAVGDHFTTYVQDEKVDEWTNDQVKTGGVGLYSERGEVATLKGGMSVLPLLIKK